MEGAKVGYGIVEPDLMGEAEVYDDKSNAKQIEGHIRFDGDLKAAHGRCSNPISTNGMHRMI